MLRIAIAQIAPTVGDFVGNAKLIKEAYKRACAKGVDICLTPELSICGYPPHDLVDRPEIFERNENALEELRLATQGQRPALVVGHVVRNPGEFGRAAQNVVTVLHNGNRIFRQAKTLLPTYDVFDENRYFEPAKENKVWHFEGIRIGLAICEDFWGHDPAFGRQLYGRDPVKNLKDDKVDLAISVSASPYVWAKSGHREELHSEVSKTLGAALVYINQIGATDEILFDGGSFATDPDGRVVGRLPFFKNSFGIVHWDGERVKFEAPDSDNREDEKPSEISVLHRGLVMGIRDYFQKTGFKKAVMGLSGGIDSAVVAALAAEAIGAEHLLGVAMPSQYSSSHSLSDAESLAKNLGCGFEVRPIKFLFATANRELAENRGELAPIAQENLQARLRGVILMTLSNHYGALVLTTGNKSETSTGYCTLYGDMVGALAPIADIFKTRVYELAREINRTRAGVIPESSISKAPSAELRPDQKDQDTLPPYELLDELLHEYVENGVAVDDLHRKLSGKFPSRPTWVRDMVRLFELNEYKRKQAAPVLKISKKAFGIGRRIPIAKVWDQKG